MGGITRRAHAKINLALHVTGLKPNGYHSLSSLVVFAKSSDLVTLSHRTDGIKTHHFTITGPFSAGLVADQTNLVMKALKSTRNALPPLQILLEKRLPVASGIGGGSADAAATLLALEDLGAHCLPNHASLLSLGADVPVCLYGCQRGGAVMMAGIGEKLKPIAHLPQLYFVLINPKIHISTASIFARLINKNNSKITIPRANFGNLQDFIVWLKEQRNDLQQPAVEACETIRHCLNRLDMCEGVLLARMSGSGATCFGLFGEYKMAQRAAEQLAHAHPDWWVVATSSVAAM